MSDLEISQSFTSRCLRHKDEPGPGQTLAPNMGQMMGIEVSFPRDFQSLSQVPSPSCCLGSLSKEAKSVEETQTLSSNEGSGQILPYVGDDNHKLISRGLSAYSPGL